jgi:hypothetical protein
MIRLLISVYDAPAAGEGARTGTASGVSLSFGQNRLNSVNFHNPN